MESSVAARPDPVRVYKLAESVGADGKKVRVVVQLRVLADGRNNFGRQNVANPSQAKYRVEKALVENITDEGMRTYEEATSVFYPFRKLTYRVGEEVVSDDWDTNDEIVCGSPAFTVF